MCIKEARQGFDKCKVTDKTLGQSVFAQTEHDNKLAPSAQDAIFLKIMDTKVFRDEANNWVTPLPFREPRQRLPNNKEQAVKQFMSLQKTLKRKPEMQQQYVAFMEKIFANGHAEVAPPLREGEECWYLPTFGVYHPQKPNQIRVVFDSSAQCTGISLNDVLLTGPDLNNTLLGVLPCFQKEKVVILADIQQVFHCFLVQEDHRNILRFLWHKCNLPRTADELAQAKDIIFKATQTAAFAAEFSALQANKPIPKDSPLRKFNPILKNDIICIGGQLIHSQLPAAEKSPVILPKDSHVSLLLTHHHHEQVRHQGCHLTEGAIRAVGLWILGGKTLINSVLHKCVTCRKLQGKMEAQPMADLPPEHLNACPPFTYVGLDVFGPWTITTRRTRGGQAESKRWAIMFSCMSSRAVHNEVIESLDTSSCINALRHFFALRGPAKQLRSDCGANFVGESKELGMDKTVQKYLSQQGCSWEFNTPHASHMGGTWERMIGIAKRILDSIFLQQHTRLTDEVLCTLMAEVTAIINAQSLLPVSSDPENPFILSPSMLLTQKAGAPPSPGDFSDKDLYTRQWRQVQALANQFWSRWRHEYLPLLQHRQKWTEPCRNLQVGDLVLLRDKQITCNCWPMARNTATFPNRDGHVRKVELKTSDQVDVKIYQRPVTEVILLLPKD
ncbi:uncharacterized protein LOC132395502 [Hypanus sabinus]|uniref:uncharacterized protein LOC132395502 n=1 Tax=Hypanus sabinus TaxID=79690 RepID=UPI0028C39045|nr:uncharacterized protein LOC132395502 [Hypanus sabinus]XP_059828205.1 uncharacterized protein LOC132395502 [Hypanus sabinus]